MAVKMEYVKRLNRFVHETDLYSNEEIREQKNRARNAMRMTDLKAEEEYARTHRHGTCPYCHMVIPASGQCGCGYNAILRRRV